MLIEFVKRYAYGDDVKPVKELLERIVKNGNAQGLLIELAIELADLCCRAKPDDYLEICKRLSEKK